MMRVSVIICLSLCVSCCYGLGRKQSAGARGTLTCHGKPLGGVQVKLYDDDRGIDSDDLMASTKTDSSGHFELSGTEEEFTTIDPKINIYHDCDDALTPCQRKVTIMLPDKYVSTGTHVSKFYDAGTLELSGKFPGESRDCLH